jgi:uncharacterized membrane protein
MPIITYNDSWMLYNCFLAILALGFCYFFIISENKFVKIIFGILWLLFFPNTIYIFTDLEHLIFQWSVISPVLRSLLLLQYIILEIIGVLTFLYAFFPFEKLIASIKAFKKRKKVLIIAFNFFIAFGMVLGRVERINSWEVFTQPLRVIGSAVHVFTSWELMVLMILFGIVCNCIYFLFRDRVLYSMKKFSHVLD